MKEHELVLVSLWSYFFLLCKMVDLIINCFVGKTNMFSLFPGYFPLPSIYCLAWICLDVLFCTASIMHLCTISVDRYLSLRYPMKFGRNKSRRRVILKIVFVWLLSIAMSLPLSLMYSQVSILLFFLVWSLQCKLLKVNAIRNFKAFENYINLCVVLPLIINDCQEQV